MPKLRIAIRDLLSKIGVYRPGRWTRLVSSEARRQFNHNKKFYAELLPPGALVFDVGANIGERAEELLQAGASVVAFEPQAHCIKQLRSRCSFARPNQLTVVESAVGAEPGTANLYMTENSAESSMAANWADAPKVATPVDVTTLDLAITRYGSPYYCKIDVEGWELEVLRGLTQPLPIVSLEFHDTPDDLAKTQQCLEYLSQLASVEFNLTPAETLEFSLSSWRPAAEFERVAQEAIRGQFPFRYGDIFIRTPSLLRAR